MGMILKNKVQQLMKGYPTVSDKYNVCGAVLEGTDAAAFGDIVTRGTTTGYYKKATTISAATDVCGFVVATNVKLNTTWPQGGADFQPGEAFNLLVSGYIAVPVDAGATLANIAPGKKVAVTAAAKVTTSGTASTYDLDGVYFTGVTEVVNGVRLAEIYVK